VQKWNEELEKALWAPRHNSSEDEEIRFSVSLFHLVSISGSGSGCGGSEGS
jgi:hypothetical protein